MKRSRRVILTMMGTAAVGTVSMGLVPDCGPGRIFGRGLGPDGQLREGCKYAGFGGAPYRIHGHGHGHVHGGGG